MSEAACLAEKYANSSGDNSNDREKHFNELLTSHAGVRISYDAYKAHKVKASREKWLPGSKLTSEQLFFISFAQMWCSVSDKRIGNSSQFNPEKVRVDMSVASMPEFSKVFKCATGSPMNKKKKCTLW